MMMTGKYSLYIQFLFIKLLKKKDKLGCLGQLDLVNDLIS